MLADLYADFVAVLRSAEHGEAVLSGLLLPLNSSAVAVADVLGTAGEESIDIKLARGNYNLPSMPLPASVPASQLGKYGPLLFFHDLKLAFGRLLGEYPQGAPEYDANTQLFKFAIDLLVREANRLGYTPNARSQHPDLESEEDEYLQQISQGFQTISTEIQDWNSETFWVTAANGPMFMSAPNKAPVDPRDTVVAGSVHTVKLLPYVARAPESTLGFASPLNPNFPQPHIPPTGLLTRFVHPNSQAIVPPLWLEGRDPYSTFAPSTDSVGAVVGQRDAESVWLEKKPDSITLEACRADRELRETERAESEAQDARESDAIDSEDVGMDDVETPEPEIVNDIELGETQEELSGGDLELLLRWTPYSFVDDDEFEAVSTGTERELASRLLLELQGMQQQRMARKDCEDVGEAERHVALKAANVLIRLVETASSEDIRLELDTRLPVLMRNYAGSLPAATDASVHSQGFQSPRLNSLAGLRNRQWPPLRR